MTFDSAITVARKNEFDVAIAVNNGVVDSWVKGKGDRVLLFSIESTVSTAIRFCAEPREKVSLGGGTDMDRVFNNNGDL